MIAHEVVLIEVQSIVANSDPLDFQIQLNQNSNLLTSQVHMHFPYYNTTCFQYGSDKSKLRFNFPKFNFENLYINKIGAIHFCCNNV